MLAILVVRREMESLMYQLYYAPDNASLVVRMVLEELGIEYTTVLVDRAIGWQTSAEYRLLNPNGLIPVCVIAGRPVFETAAILLALAERHANLAPPPSAVTRPEFLQWLFYLSNSVHSDERQLFYPGQYVGEDEGMQSYHRKLTALRMEQRLQILERHCASLSGPFMMDNEFSVLDMYLAVLLRWIQLYPRGDTCLEGLQAYPELQRLTQAVAQRPGVQRACLQEGIAAPFFDNPGYAEPSEGTAT